jgi:dCMP deaminase
VIVTADNRVVSFSYNGPPRGMQVEGPCINWCPRAMTADIASVAADYSTCPAVHAEANAIIRASYDDLAGGTIYVTSAMCINCAKIIANSGLVRVVHVVAAEDAHRHPDEVEAFLKASGITTARARLSV